LRSPSDARGQRNGGCADATPRAASPNVSGLNPTPDPFTRRAIITVAVIGLAFIVWQLRDVLPLLFGAILLAIGLRALADELTRVTPLWPNAALGVVVIALIALIGGIVWLVGARLAGQLAGLVDALPRALQAVRDWLADTPFASLLAGTWQSMVQGGVPLPRVAGAAGVATGAFINTILVIALGLYLAGDPALYVRGTLRLLPPAYRGKVGATMGEAARALRRWLLAQLFAMTTIGVMTAIGLFLLGVPLAVSLGLVAGLTEFVPFFGPIAFGVFAVLFSFTVSPTTALYVALLCFGIQQFEGNVLQPVVQRWAVSLPPALGVISVLIFGLLFGFLGAVFATPLMTVVMIFVERLYENVEPEPG
jgi:predicted PurR-regulated permease PerM